MMMYNIRGITYADIEGMPMLDREWYLERLLKQKKQEWKAYKRK